MLNRERFREFIPANGMLKGLARLSFSGPDGEIRGTGTIKFPPNERPSVSVEVESHSIPPEYHGLLMPFLEGSPPETNGGCTTFGIGSGQKERGIQLEIVTPEGHFRSSSVLIGRSHFDMFGGTNARIDVVPFGLEFSVETPASEEIWCMPLIGDLGEFRFCSNACCVSGRRHYIHFTAGCHDCGLAVFDLSEKANEYSAAAFGKIGDRPHKSINQVSDLIPWGLFAALDFASGSDMRAPWIELRGHDGTFIRRIHLQFGGNETEPGFGAFSKFDSARPGSGIAEFLVRFFSMTAEQRRLLTPTLSLIRRGAPGSGTVDESITSLIKAVEATCKRQGLGRVNLETKLDTSNLAAVRPILGDTKEKLKRVRRQSRDDGRSDQLAVLDKIISRLANVAGDELDFGITFSELLQRFGLKDGDVMEKYYSKLSGGTTWEGLLSSIRGEVIHEGAIHVDGRAEIVSWFQFSRHLHDICKRIVLLEIGYKGTYAASNVSWSGTYELDRIEPSMNTEQLGYTLPPTTLR